MKKIITLVMIVGLTMSMALSVYAKEDPDPKIVNPPIVIMGEDPDPK